MNRQLYQTGGNTLPIYPRIEAIENSLGGAEKRIGDPALGQSSNSPLSNVYNNETSGTGIGSIFGNTGGQQPNPIQPRGAVDPIGFPQQPGMPQPIQPGPSVDPIRPPKGLGNPYTPQIDPNRDYGYNQYGFDSNLLNYLNRNAQAGAIDAGMGYSYDPKTQTFSSRTPRSQGNQYENIPLNVLQQVSTNPVDYRNLLQPYKTGGIGFNQPQAFSYGGRAGYQEGGIRSLSQAKDILQKHAPEGEHLAYINPQEANLLRRHGGSGIMTVTGIPSFGLLKTIRNIIPNELASVASAAAPFVAPFNPLLAAGMSAFGTFDKTGSLSGSLKSAALNYVGGQLGRYVGGSGFQTGFNPFDAASLGQSASSFIGVPYSSPLGTTTGLQLGQYTDAGRSAVNQMEPFGGSATTGTLSKTPGTLDQLKTIFDPTSGVDFGTRAKTAMDLSGDAIKAMYTNKDGSVDKRMVVSTLVAIPSYLDAKKKADQIGLSPSEFNEQIYNAEKSKYQTAYQSRLPMESFGIRTTAASGGIMDDGSGILSIKLTPAQGMAMGGEIPMRQNQGGISELDLRAKGGYIPVGIKEKADDVPAMLSKNEFVFTADAVRGAGNGSINKGAQKMYKLMKSLEKKVKQNKVA